MGDAKKIEKFLKNGANANQTGELGLSALHHAVFSNNRLAVKVLIQYGANINAVNNSGETPIVYAVRQKSYSVLKTLLSANPDLSIKDEKGATAFYYLLRKKEKKHILTLLKSIRNAEIYGDGVTSTHLLANFAEDRSFSLYLKNTQPNLNVKDNKGLTPLDYASIAENWTGVEFLLANGADINQSYLSGGYLISQAILRKKSRLLKNVIENRDNLDISINGWSPLMLAALNRCFTCIDVLIKKKVSPNYTTNNFSPLHISAQVDGVRVASRLIDAGADLEARSQSGTTPLMQASRHGGLRVAERLLKKGALPDAVDNYGRNAFFYAYPEPGETESGNIDLMVRLLKKYGGNPSKVDVHGETAFQRFNRRKKEYEYRLA